MIPKRKLFNASLFGRRFAYAIRHLSCRQAAKDIGISHATISRVQRGYEPDIETYLRIVKWMSRKP